jgi:hypothetical protein
MTENMIHEITRIEITRSNANNISCQFVSLVRVDSWIDCLLKNTYSRKQELDCLLHKGSAPGAKP